VAGGAVLQRHGYRASEDLDVFNAPNINVVAAAELDITDLRAAGFEVSPTTRYEGFVEAIAAKPDIGTTKIQWVQYSGYNFYQPVPDPEFGWRLHFADLAVNKVLAAASRRQPRDLIDLYLVHTFIMPLWHAVWAAPGKDVEMTPEKAVEAANRTLYGLTSSILAGDTYRAFELAPKVLAGIVNINSPTVNDEIHAPMGGVRDSGWGRTGPESLKEFQDLIWINSHSGQRQYPF